MEIPLNYFLIHSVAMIHLPLLLFLLVALPSPATSWNVLFANVCNTGSHQTVSVHVANLLVDNGHTVTYMSTNMPNSALRPQVRKLDLPNLTADMRSLTHPTDNETTSFRGILRKADFFLRMCERWYEEENVRSLLLTSSPEKYDLFVTSGLFETCALGLAHHLGIENAVIQMPGAIATPYIIHELGLPLYSSSSAITLLTVRNSTGVRSSITARALNIGRRLLFDNILYGLWGWYVEPVMYKHIPTYPGYRETYKTVKLMLMHYHHHPLIDGPALFGPGVLPLAGTLCKPYNQDDISPELLNFMDSASGGVVFVSFGSMQKDGNAEEQSKLIEVFSGLAEHNYKVVWKQEKVEETVAIPDNVMLVTWVGQMSLLQHPNMRLFITHGGYASKTESICAGVPLLVIPRFAADQYFTADQITNTGLGDSIPDLDTTSGPEILGKVMGILQNADYSNLLKEVKEQMLLTRTTNDQLLGHLSAAVSGHSYIAGRQPWYEYLYLDIVAIPVVTVLGVRALVRRVRGQ